jgi:hypothetical protein
MTEDLISTTFEMAAEIGGDLAPAIYANYFARCPGSQALMSHIDDIVRGKMLEEVYRLLMLSDYSGEQGYLNFEMKNHKLAYSVEALMYGNLLAAILDTVRDAIGDQWQPSFEAAWQQRINDLTLEIQHRI